MGRNGYMKLHLKIFLKCSLVINGSSPGRLGCTIRCDIVAMLSEEEAHVGEDAEYEEVDASLWLFSDVILVLCEMSWVALLFTNKPIGLEETVFGDGTLKKIYQTETKIWLRFTDYFY